MLILIRARIIVMKVRYKEVKFFYGTLIRRKTAGADASLHKANDLGLYSMWHH